MKLPKLKLPKLSLKLKLPALKLPRLRLPQALLAKLPAGLAARLGAGAADGDADDEEDIRPLRGAGRGRDDDDQDNHDHEAEPDDRPRWKRLLPWGVVAASWLVVLGVVGAGWFWLSAHREEIVARRAAENPAIVLSAEEIASQLARQAAEAERAAEPAPGGESAAAGETLPEVESAATEDAGVDPPDPFRELMAPHPDMALIEESDSGPLPVVAPDGRKAWKVYSRPANAIETRPRIAIVVIGLGQKTEATERALALPGAVTLAFTPTVASLRDWVAIARDDGHEVLLGLPMEPGDFPRNDPGPEALMTALSSEQNMARLRWLMGRGTGYIGFINVQGERFLGDPASFRPIAEELSTRGLMFLEAARSPVPAAPDLARQVGLPVLTSSLWLDQTLSRSGVEAALAELETRARTNGMAIGVTNPYPVALARLRGWIRGLEEKGFALVPVSALLDGPPS